jgi:hypothetical protein
MSDDLVSSVLKALDQANATSNIFRQEEEKPAVQETPVDTPQAVVNELTISTITGVPKEVNKVKLTTVTGAKKKAYPGKSGSARSGQGGVDTGDGSGSGGAGDGGSGGNGP